MPDPFDMMAEMDKSGPVMDPLSANREANSLGGGDLFSAMGGDANEASRLRLSVAKGQDIVPERAAKVQSLRAKTGLPPDLIDRNLETIERETQAKDFDAYEFRRKSPIVAGWIAEHPDHAAIAREDYDRLGTMEALWSSLGGIYEGQYENQLGRAGAKLATGDRSPENLRRIASLEAELARTPDGSGFIASMLRPTLKVIGGFVDTVGNAQDAAAAGAAGGATAALVAGQAGPQVVVPEEVVTVPVAAGVGYLGGLGWGLFRESAVIEGGHQYLALDKIRGVNGEKIDETTKRGAAAVVGLANGALELVGLKMAAAPFKSAARRFFSDGIKDALARPTSARVIGQFGADWAKAVGGEVTTEVMQEMAGILGDEVAKMATAGEFDTLMNSPGERANAMDRLVSVASETLRSTMLLGGAGAGMNAAAGMRQVRRAKEAEKFFKAIGENSAESKTLQRLPAAMQEIVSRITKDGPVENLYVPVEKWSEYFQSKGQDPRAIAAEVTGDPKAFDRAVESGEDIIIPTARYAAKIAPTEHHAAFVKELRISPAEMNATEAEEFQKNLEQQVKDDEASEDGKAESDDGAAFELLRDSLTDRLVAAATESGAAKAQATAYARGLLSLSKRMGADPLELAERFPLQVQREDGSPLAPGERRLDQRTEDRMRRGGFLTAQEAEERRAALSVDPRAETDRIVRKKPAAPPASDQLVDGIDVDEVELNQSSKQTDTPAFKKWFGDSKIVDADGKPLVVYHGTGNDFDTFEMSDDRARDSGFLGRAFYFTRNRDFVTAFGPKVMPVYLRASNPLDIRTVGIDELVRLANLVRENKGKPPMPADMEAAARGDWERATRPGDNAAYGGPPPIQREKMAKIFGDTSAMARAGGYDAVMGASEQAIAVFDPTQIKSATGNNGSFDPENPSILHQGEDDERRGSLRFTTGSNRKFTLTLTPNADLSTALHELGHYFLEVMGDLAADANAPQQIKDDYATTLKWFGVDSREQIEVKHHEQWARGFELYLREGKAPSSAMREAFVKFKAWLSFIYRSVSELSVQLNDDVREVMDRLLAADDEILSAEEDASVQPAFATAKDAGMSDEEFAAYGKTVARASSAAREELEQKLMSQLAREREDWWKDARAKMREEVEAEVNKQPVQIALAVLRKGTLPDGSALPEGLRPLKLRRSAIPGDAKLPRGITAPDGVSPDMAAEVFGFRSGAELLGALEKMRPRAEEIKAETDRRMSAAHGDMMTDGTIAEAAREAVAGEHRSKVVQAEIRALRRLQRESRPIVRDAVKVARIEERGKADARVADAEAQARAEAIVDKAMGDAKVGELKAEQQAAKVADTAKRNAMHDRLPPLESFQRVAAERIRGQKVRDLNPQLHWNAARRSARQAFKFAAAKKYDQAADAKMRELLNLELHRESARVKREADSAVKYLRNFEKDSTRGRIGKAGGPYLDQIDALLARFSLTKLSAKGLDKRIALGEWVLQAETYGEEIDVPQSLIDEAKKQHFSTLTVDELMGLRDTVKQIAHLASKKNEFLSSKIKREKDEAKAELIEALEMNFNDPKRKAPPLTAAGLTVKDRAGRLLQQFDASLIKMEQLVDWMDGGKLDGPWRTYLFEGASDAQAAEYGYTKKITAKIAQAVMSVPKEIRETMLDRVEIPGIDRPIVRRDLIGVALNLGNESNKSKLMKGMGWTESQVQEMADNLTTEEIAFVNTVHETLESMWPDIAKLQKELTGLEPDKIQPSPFAARNGTIKGGYYPIIYDPIATEQGGLQLSAEAGKMIEQGYTRATTPRGHTKARVEGFSAPFDLDIDRLPSHTAGVIKDLTHRKWVMDANWIVNDKDIKAALQKHLGDAYVGLFPDWVKAVANDRNADVKSMKVWKRVMEQARFNVMIAGMGFKAATMFSQVAGAGASIEIVGAKPFAKAMGKFTMHPRVMYDAAIEKSGEMRHRIQTRDVDLRDNLRRLSGKTDLLSQIQEVSLKGIAWADMAISIPTWHAAYSNAIEAGETEAHAVIAGDRAVRLSQGSGGAKDLSAVMDKNHWTRLITMFYTPFSALYSRLRNVGHETKGMKDAPNMLLRLFWVWAVPSTVGALASGNGPDEDEGWLEWWGKTALVYPFAAIPALRDIMNMVVGDYGYSFTPIARAAESVGKVANSAVDVVQGEGDLDKLAGDTFKASGYLLGVPTGQVGITGGYIKDLVEGDANPDGLTEFAHDMIFRRKE